MSLEVSSGVLSPLKYSVVKLCWFEPGTFQRGRFFSSEQGDELLAEISSVTQTSDATPGECLFSIDDPDTAIIPRGSSKVIIIPKIGDEI